MTVSPCSCITMRNTPWVLGCCGPRLRVIRFSSSTTPSPAGASNMLSPSSAPGRAVRPGVLTRMSAIDPAPQSVCLVNELFDGDVLIVCLVVPPHGETDEVVRQQYAAQIRVAEEADAHHFE